MDLKPTIFKIYVLYICYKCCVIQMSPSCISSCDPLSPAACQRGGLVSVWPLPGGWLCGGGVDGVGREEQAVCGEVPLESTCRCSPSCSQRSKVIIPACVCCRQRHEKGFTVCCLAWHPSGGQIAYTDTEGRLGLLDGVGSSGTDTSKVLETHLKLRKKTPPPPRW